MPPPEHIHSDHGLSDPRNAPPLRLGVCGTGKVATAFLRRWSTLTAAVDVRWVWGRRPDAVEEMRKKVGGTWQVLGDWRDGVSEVDWIALAVSDDAIPEFHAPLPNGVRTFHFSGSVACPAHGAVLWPIRAIQEDIPPDFDTLPCALQISAGHNSDGHHDTAFEAFMRQTAPNCRLMNDEERMQAHIAAVFAANISNHAFAIAQDLAHAAGLPWETFAPLVQGVGQIATAGHSRSAQTGPALRRDAGTLERHRVWLKQHAPQWLPLYNAASASIQNHDTTPTP